MRRVSYERRDLGTRTADLTHLGEYKTLDARLGAIEELDQFLRLGRCTALDVLTRQQSVVGIICHADSLGLESGIEHVLYGK